MAHPEELPPEYIALMHRRAFFIGDRVAASQVSFFLASGGLLHLLQPLVGFVGQWILWVGFPIVLMLVYLVATAVEDRVEHWLWIYGAYALVWLTATMALGLWLLSARGLAWTLGLYLSTMYGCGYLLARLIRSLQRKGLSGIFSGYLVLLPLGLLCGWLWGVGKPIMEAGMATCTETSRSWSAISSCAPGFRGLIWMTAGPGAGISMLLHYHMLHALFDPAGDDVEECHPNTLYLETMFWSVAVSFVAWLLAMLSCPPAAGGGGGGRSNTDSSQDTGLDADTDSLQDTGLEPTEANRNKAAPLPVAAEQKGTFQGHSPETVEAGWARYGLGRPESP